MAKLSRPRYGSLQFYPRKRIDKFLPSVNWSAVSSEVEGLQGFIVYKAAMASAVVKDMTDKSMTQNKKIVIPVTILEVPHMKIFSIRFYKSGDVIGEVVVSNDKELKRKLKVPKQIKDFESVKKDFDDVRVIVYSLPKQIDLKKTPDLSEISINSKDKLEYAKSLIGKEIPFNDFVKNKIVDVRGLTKGKGLQGPLTRFGFSLKAHKSEKGRRRPGSLAPWHPARVTFRTPMAGQMGLFTRVHYNILMINSGDIKTRDINPKSGFKHYGKITSNYIILKGSVQGVPMRQLLLTAPIRPTKAKKKEKLEFLELINKK